ncbi:hypothetical protein [Consotaella aegiceratis]|uniref:hypothetical protein n=1 Tax=Consotaella aegiceratis TaxID=3097961 RepID=UPI002F40A05C
MTRPTATCGISEQNHREILASMPRRYWFIIVAFGIVVLAALQQSCWAQEQNRNPEEQIYIPPPPFGLFEQTEEPNGPAQPCEQGREDRSSDLCAQWKAADAAKKSADWGAFSVCIGVVTFLAAAVAAIYAGSTSKASWASVAETRRIGEAQVRAYLDFEHVTIGYDAANQCLTFSAMIINNGQSPALSADFVVEVTLFCDEGLKILIIPMEISGVPLAGLTIPEVSHTTARLSHHEFSVSAGCHVEICLFSTDVFGKEADEHVYFAKMGRPEPTYVFGIGDRMPVPARVLNQERLDALRRHRAGNRGPA